MCLPTKIKGELECELGRLHKSLTSCDLIIIDDDDDDVDDDDDNDDDGDDDDDDDITWFWMSN